MPGKFARDPADALDEDRDLEADLNEAIRQIDTLTNALAGCTKQRDKLEKVIRTYWAPSYAEEIIAKCNS